MPCTSRPPPFVLIAIVATTAACSPTLDWREARPEGGAITVLLPCKPERRTRQVVLADATTTVEVLACEAGGTTWGVTSADVADAERIGPVMAAMRAARAQNLDGRETEARPVQTRGTLFDSPPLRLKVEGRRPDGQPVTEHSLLFAYGSRVLHVAAIGGSPSERALETFFDSLAPSR